jgi:3-phenylpropionate/trans-cinnamate dioxygenase ferredoxin reductase subunit
LTDDVADPVVVVGGGLAGAKVVETLRTEGFTDPIVLLAAEPELPYERPPLSKGYLAGKDPFEKAVVHDEAWYHDHEVDLRRTCTATAVRPADHQVDLDDGSTLTYQRLVLATGATPIRPPIPGADDALVLRTRADADRLRAAIGGAEHLVVVGAGWIGLETAAIARGAGVDVTVLEMAPAPLARSLGARIGAAWGEAHRRHGVDLRTGVQVTAVAADGVTLADGSRLGADVVVLGVGARPATELAASAGLTVDNGVVTDAALRSSHPDVLAVGDVANAFHPRYRTHIRVEHWANALHQGPAAARTILGMDVAYDRTPYFYTDQYDLGMEYSGHVRDAGREVVVRGDVEADYQAFWVRPATDGHVVVEAAMHVNRWEPGIEPLKGLVEAETPVARDRLADDTVPLSELTR